MTPAYTPRLTARRVGDIGPLWSTTGDYRTFYGADEFFTCRELPPTFLRGMGVDWPERDDGKAELVCELRDLFRDAVRELISPGAPQLRDGVWWAQLTHHARDPDAPAWQNAAWVPLGLEVKLDLYEAVDRGYVRSRGGQGTMGYKYPRRKSQSLPEMEWRLVTAGDQRQWLVLARRGFAGRHGGWPMAGAVLCHRTA